MNGESKIQRRFEEDGYDDNQEDYDEEIESLDRELEEAQHDIITSELEMISMNTKRHHCILRCVRGINSDNFKRYEEIIRKEAEWMKTSIALNILTDVKLSILFNYWLSLFLIAFKKIVED